MRAYSMKTILVLLFSLLLPGFAAAEGMEDSNIVYGGDSPRFVYGFDAYIDPFMIEQAGTYEATLVDLQFPNEFDYIGFMVTQGALDQKGVIEGTGSFMFNAEPGLYNAVFVGSVSPDLTLPGPSATLGTYGVQVALVPELETWLMMILGLFGVAYWIRRGKNQPLISTNLAAV